MACRECPRKGKRDGRKGPRKGRATQQSHDKSGRNICEKGHRITVLAYKQCDVKSRSLSGFRRAAEKTTAPVLNASHMIFAKY